MTALPIPWEYHDAVIMLAEDQTSAEFQTQLGNRDLIKLVSAVRTVLGFHARQLEQDKKFYENEAHRLQFDHSGAQERQAANAYGMPRRIVAEQVAIAEAKAWLEKEHNGLSKHIEWYCKEKFKSLQTGKSEFDKLRERYTGNKRKENDIVDCAVKELTSLTYAVKELESRVDDAKKSVETKRVKLEEYYHN